MKRRVRLIVSLPFLCRLLPLPVEAGPGCIISITGLWGLRIVGPPGCGRLYDWLFHRHFFADFSLSQWKQDQGASSPLQDYEVSVLLDHLGVAGYINIFWSHSLLQTSPSPSGSRTRVHRLHYRTMRSPCCWTTWVWQAICRPVSVIGPPPPIAPVSTDGSNVSV